MGYREPLDGAIHLAAGLLMAGYRSIVATMWSIQDDAVAAPIVAGVYKCMINEASGDSGTRTVHAPSCGSEDRNTVGCVHPPRLRLAFLSSAWMILRHSREEGICLVYCPSLLILSSLFIVDIDADLAVGDAVRSLGYRCQRFISISLAQSSRPIP
jgi:hypothetical protein